MGDEQALLAGILARPADDTPRLVYADWLDENGDADGAALAAVIRAQGEPLAVAGYDFSGSDAHRWLVLSVEGVGKAHVKLPGYGPPDSIFFVRRGFVEGLRVSLRWWLRHGPRIVRAHPVCGVEATDRAIRPWNGTQWFRWHLPLPSPNALDHGELPPPVYDVLTGGEHIIMPSGVPYCRHYPDEADARSALSSALVAWARVTEPDANPYKDLTTPGPVADLVAGMTGEYREADFTPLFP